MKLDKLLERLDYTVVQGSDSTEVTTLINDSRKVEEGSVFVCISGAVSDGHKYAADVAAKGAAAVVVEKDVEVPENVTVIKVEDTRYALAQPGEKSSGKKQKRIAITKAGTGHIRKELIEAAQSICRGLPGYKSRALLARQQGNDTTVINYADKASARLRRRYYKLGRCGKKHNVAVTAVARELSCFICGMMNGLTEVQIKKA